MRNTSLILSVLLFCPQTQVTQPAPGTKRDPQALAVLSSAYGATSGAALMLAKDTSSEMMLVAPTDEQASSGTVLLKTMGKGVWKAEADTLDGASVLVLNGSQGMSQSRSDQQSFLTISIAEAGNWFLPAYSIIGEYADPSLNISYLGLEGSTHHIQLLRTSTDPTLQEVLSPCDVYIDSATSLPFRLTYFLHPPADLKIRIPAQVEYSDYRAVSGVLLPYDVKFSIRGKLIAEYKLSSFTANVGLSPSEFSVTAGAL